MRKLKLQVDELEVDSFAPARGVSGLRGTIRGHWTFLCNTNEYTCVNCYTFNSCAGDGEPCGTTLTAPTVNNPTCVGETCQYGKTCIPPT